MANIHIFDQNLAYTIKILVPALPLDLTLESRCILLLQRQFQIIQ